MLTVATLLKRHNLTGGEGDRSFWRDRGAEYLQKLHRGVRQYLPADTRMVCLCDSLDGIPEDVAAIAIQRPQDPAWWVKTQMFGADLSGTVLYLDLDNVLSGPLDELLALKPDPLIMTDDRHFPGLPNGSTMLFNADRMRHVWDTYLDAPEQIQQTYSKWPHAADQGYLAAIFPGVPLFQQLLPDGYMLNSLTELGDDWSDARLVFGCSVPKPHQSTHPFYAEHWAS